MQHDVSCRISVSTFFISYTVYILQCVLFGVFYRFYYLPFLFPECTVYLTSLLYVNVYLSIFSYRCVCYITFTQSQRFSRDCNLVLDCEQSLFFFFFFFQQTQNSTIYVRAGVVRARLKYVVSERFVPHRDILRLLDRDFREKERFLPVYLDF